MPGATPPRVDRSRWDDLELEDISLNVGGRWALERLTLDASDPAR